MADTGPPSLPSFGPPPIQWEDPSAWESVPVDNTPLSQVDQALNQSSSASIYADYENTTANTADAQAIEAAQAALVANNTAAAAFGRGTGDANSLDFLTQGMTGRVSSSAINASGTNVATPNDTRIRLSPISSAFGQVLGDADINNNVLYPLYATGGLLFPYTPQIAFTQEVDYKAVDLVQSNSDILSYSRTPSVTLSITGKFSIQNQAEGAYVLACVHFLRVASKMYFGDNYGGQASSYKGLPPPILVLTGYGSYMFGTTQQGLRVILKSHNYTYDQNMDTVLVSAAGGTARLPALFDISMTLVVQQTPRALRKDFDLGLFRTGALMRSKGGWI